METEQPEMAAHLQQLLRATQQLNPAFCVSSFGCKIRTTLNYPLAWGLGSSSTLVAAIASWAGVNPFDLHFSVSQGSGYDIACALSNGPIKYRLDNKTPVYQPVAFSPSFANRIFFAYQGKKQDSAEGIRQYQILSNHSQNGIIEEVNAITEGMIHASSLPEFELLLLQHELLISNLIQKTSIKQTIFNDLPGEVKSLGAWGGDFCMLTWHDELHLLPAYLKRKGLETSFNFRDIVI